MALEATLGSSPNLDLRAEVGKKAVLEDVWKTSLGGPSGSKCVFREAGGSLSWGGGRGRTGLSRVRAGAPGPPPFPEKISVAKRKIR